MSGLTTKDKEHVLEALREGLVRERGIDTFAVGIEKQRGEVQRQIELARNGKGAVKFFMRLSGAASLSWPVWPRGGQGPRVSHQLCRRVGQRSALPPL